MPSKDEDIFDVLEAARGGPFPVQTRVTDVPAVPHGTWLDGPRGS